MIAQLFRPVAPAARKALSLKNDIVFRLLVVMTVLLGWLLGTGAAAIMALDQLYDVWELNQKSRITLYLPSGSGKAEVNDFLADLKQQTGVKAAIRLPEEDLRALLGIGKEDMAGLPLPVVIDMTVDENLDRKLFDPFIEGRFPSAEMDDARDMLAAVAGGVRFAQFVGFTLAAVILAIMILLVSLTVTAGLRHQKDTLMILQYVGTTDGFLRQLVMGQVWRRSAAGFGGAFLLSTATLALIHISWPTLGAAITPTIWAAALLSPLCLPILAAITAWFATGYVVGSRQL